MINFSPTHLTSVETDKGKINVMAKKTKDNEFLLDFGYPKRLVMVSVKDCSECIVIDGIVISNEEIAKVVDPIE